MRGPLKPKTDLAGGERSDRRGRRRWTRRRRRRTLLAVHSSQLRLHNTKTIVWIEFSSLGRREVGGRLCFHSRCCQPEKIISKQQEQERLTAGERKERESSFCIWRLILQHRDHFLVLEEKKLKEKSHNAAPPGISEVLESNSGGQKAFLQLRGSNTLTKQHRLKTSRAGGERREPRPKRPESSTVYQASERSSLWKVEEVSGLTLGKYSITSD